MIFSRPNPNHNRTVTISIKGGYTSYDEIYNIAQYHALTPIMGSVEPTILTCHKRNPWKMNIINSCKDNIRAEIQEMYK